ncbi:MAG: glucose 1-dehydrogenase [Candidatus Eisenbacteria bacterium]|uniref:Glucose 1-dehydrogenase n=1 Tax=Eiseniibacteriota bacterium TaxID=2212470 RepID=A0A849SNR2_UNCEI|nr:glucose 1-dehydrogenase [Candidatus Eisenbacteria bacterium]
MSNHKRFASKCALVTGASSGIGRATARRLAEEGADVVAVGRRLERLEEVVRELKSSGARAVAVAGDVREAAVCDRAVTTAIEHFGGLDSLVHAAGVIGSGSLADTTSDEWDRVMDSNLKSIFLLTRRAAPELAKRRGAIVSISSVASIRPYANLTPYCVSKAALDMFTKCAALEYAPAGVRVNAVNPGVVVTELHTVANAVPDYPGFLEHSKSTHPLGRVGAPEEIAALVVYLLSEEAGWITGATYSIDGGRALVSAR